MTLKLHELTPSPNSVKVRIALAYKELDYERLPIELDSIPGDRSAIIAVSGQPRLPVLVHDGTVIFDSGAILRYLDANFRDTPRLFVEDYEQHAALERWEITTRTELTEPIGLIFSQLFAPAVDAAVIARANALVAQRTAPIEELLATREFLLGDTLTAADVTVASHLYLTDLNEKIVGDSPISRFFLTHLKLGEGREKTRAWVRKVLAYDPIKGQR